MFIKLSRRRLHARSHIHANPWRFRVIQYDFFCINWFRYLFYENGIRRTGDCICHWIDWSSFDLVLSLDTTHQYGGERTCKCTINTIERQTKQIYSMIIFFIGFSKTMRRGYGICRCTLCVYLPISHQALAINRNDFREINKDVQVGFDWMQ